MSIRYASSKFDVVVDPVGGEPVGCCCAAQKLGVAFAWQAAGGHVSRKMILLMTPHEAFHSFAIFQDHFLSAGFGLGFSAFQAFAALRQYPSRNHIYSRKLCARNWKSDVSGLRSS